MCTDVAYVPTVVKDRRIQPPPLTFASTLASGSLATTSTSIHQSLPTALGVKDALKAGALADVELDAAGAVLVDVVEGAVLVLLADAVVGAVVVVVVDVVVGAVLVVVLVLVGAGGAVLVCVAGGAAHVAVFADMSTSQACTG